MRSIENENNFYEEQNSFIVPFRLKSKRSKLVKLDIDGGKQSSSLSERINCRNA